VPPHRSGGPFGRGLCRLSPLPRNRGPLLCGWCHDCWVWAFFHVMASLAQMERELIAERTKAGLAAARKRGRVGGRKRRMTPGKVESARQLLAGGMPPGDVARNLGVSIPTLYRWVPAASRPRYEM
jgi:DNA invertase Pin-like site-specific DNA recombinase